MVDIEIPVLITTYNGILKRILDQNTHLVYDVPYDVSKEYRIKIRRVSYYATTIIYCLDNQIEFHIDVMLCGIKVGFFKETEYSYDEIRIASVEKLQKMAHQIFQILNSKYPV